MDDILKTKTIFFQSLIKLKSQTFFIYCMKSGVHILYDFYVNSTMGRHLIFYQFSSKVAGKIKTHNGLSKCFKIL